MAKVNNTGTSCLHRSSKTQQLEMVTDVKDVSETDKASSFSTATPSSSSSSVSSNKRTDVATDAGKQPGIFWRVTTGLYGTASGAVGAGVGGVRWVAGKTYNISAAVASKVPVPSLTSSTKKNKDE